MTTKEIWYLVISLYHIIVILIGHHQVSNALTIKTKLAVLEDGKNHLWKFISVWVQVFNQIFFHLSFFYQWLNRFGSPKKINWFKMELHNFLLYLLFSLVFPLTMLICFGFWGLFLYDRNMIYPAELDDYFPFFYCHIYHTVPAALVLMEMLRGYKKLPQLSSSLIILSSITIIYIAVLLKTYIDEKKWVYLFFYEMSVNQAIAAHVLSFIILPSLLFFASFFLNGLIIKISEYLAIRIRCVCN
ncbi:androgen-dependent TFPI-regulating protein-like [Lycorma delicatula]|uniref:androgen-dependent TFPI-regulating protein-like n=1 Tax=Lycorma delicatula TaxID=130591 RepID=UPI003F51AAC3